jgi:hypothetical protein
MTHLILTHHHIAPRENREKFLERPTGFMDVHVFLLAYTFASIFLVQIVDHI